MFGPGVGAGLAELDPRAPFWVGAFTSFTALIIATIYLKSPEELFPGGVPLGTSGKLNLSSLEPGAPPPPAPPTPWRQVAVLAAGSLASNTAFASVMTCQALYLQALFGFGSLQFGFVMMGTATFSIAVRTLAFNKIQTSLGLMKTALLGGLMGTVTYAGYSFLPGNDLGMWIFFILAGVGTVGSTFSGSSVTPYFSQLANRKQDAQSDPAHSLSWRRLLIFSRVCGLSRRKLTVPANLPQLTRDKMRIAVPAHPSQTIDSGSPPHVPAVVTPFKLDSATRDGGTHSSI